MRCPNCGGENKDSAKFCFRCGQKIAVFTPIPPAPAVQIGVISQSNAAILPAVSPNEDLSTRPLSCASILLIESGKKIEIPSIPITYLGRADKQSSYTPEIDFTQIDRNKVISRKHACISFSNNKYKLSDLGSTNGTFLNGLRLQTGVEYDLKNGDEIIFGKITSIFSSIG